MVQLSAKKDTLTCLIVHMDEELEALRYLPEDLQLARLDTASGTVEGLTTFRFRQGLARTREEARLALVRCDEVVDEFDAVLRIPDLTPIKRAQQMATIRDVPPETLSRLKFEIFRGRIP